MPTPFETYNHACTGGWEAVAGPGQVFIENLNAKAELEWAIAGASGPGPVRGYKLPVASGYRSGAEGINIPADRRLWLRGTAGQGAILTVETLP